MLNPMKLTYNRYFKNGVVKHLWLEIIKARIEYGVILHVFLVISLSNCPVFLAHKILIRIILYIESLMISEVLYCMFNVRACLHGERVTLVLGLP